MSHDKSIELYACQFYFIQKKISTKENSIHDKSIYGTMIKKKPSKVLNRGAYAAHPINHSDSNQPKICPRKIPCAKETKKKNSEDRSRCLFFSLILSILIRKSSSLGRSSYVGLHSLSPLNLIYHFYLLPSMSLWLPPFPWCLAIAILILFMQWLFSVF